MSNNSSLLLIIGMFLMISSSMALNTFKYSPDYKYYTGWSQPTILKISSNQDSILVGYSDGSLRLYSVYGIYQSTWSGHNYSIIDIEWIPGYGPITLDSSGKAIRWSNYGSSYMTWNMNSTSVIDMAVTSSGGWYYVAFNLGSVVYEYNAIQQSYNLTQTYRSNGTSFKRIEYDSSHNYLYAATSNSYVVYFSCQTGTQYYSNISTSYTAKDMKLMSNNYVAILTSGNYIYKFYYTPTSATYFYPTYSPSIFTVCPSTNLIITAEGYSYGAQVYDYYSGTRYQELNYFNSYIKAMDCSYKYFVAYDSYGYLTINTYGSPTPPVPIPVNVAVGLIVGIVVGTIVFFIVIVFLIVFCVKKRRARRLMIQGNYQRAPVVGSEPYFQQPGLKINFQVGGNQGYVPPLPNQQYSSNQQYVAHQTSNQPINPYSPPQPYQPTYQAAQTTQNNEVNPYQANQPRNWS